MFNILWTDNSYVWYMYDVLEAKYHKRIGGKFMNADCDTRNIFRRFPGVLETTNISTFGQNNHKKSGIYKSIKQQT